MNPDVRSVAWRQDDACHYDVGADDIHEYQRQPHDRICTPQSRSGSRNADSARGPTVAMMHPSTMCPADSVWFSSSHMANKQIDRTGKGSQRVISRLPSRRVSPVCGKDIPNIGLRCVEALRGRLHEAHDRAGLDCEHHAQKEQGDDRRQFKMRTLGTVASVGTQNTRMPARIMAITTANPDRIKSAVSVQDVASTAATPIVD